MYYMLCALRHLDGDDMLAEFYLEKFVSEDNQYKYYRSATFRNIFGDIQIDREWGRVGNNPRYISDLYPDLESAVLSMQRVKHTKISRGYSLIYQDIPKEPYVGLIPRRLYGYLDVKTFELFRADSFMYEVCERAARYGVIYTGSFVQLSAQDMIAIKVGRSECLSDLQDTTKAYISTIQSKLRAFGLCLSASVPGWQPPSGSAWLTPNRRAFPA